ncbi:MAG: hypothetical protein VKN33_07825 [Candidatus Sericytochromatia bacterium]|nr:hypothetical protein [Candidatus Sericytochromatia bacterium]
MGVVCIALAALEPEAPARGPAVLDFAFALLRVFGAFTALWWTIRSWEQELAGRTLHVVLSKPISRVGYLWARYLGVLGALGVGAAVTLVALSGLMLVLQTFEPLLCCLVIAMWFEWALLAAMALFFATVTAPLLAWLYGVSFFILGHFAIAIRIFADTEIRVNAANYYLGHILYYAVPHFDLFDRARLLYQGSWSWAQWGAGLLYAGALAGLFVCVAGWNLESKELE